MTRTELFGYSLNAEYQTSVAYFSMEFAIDQSLKIYSGGLGFLSGSHLRSAFELKQNLLGIGMLWKYGYYDQVRDKNNNMVPAFIQKDYSFLEDTGIILSVPVHSATVKVKAFLLRPATFGTAPLFLLSTDLPENDEVSRSITHRLYDPNEATRIAQSIILGIGGGMLLDQLNLQPDYYHMNEGHAVPLNFYLYSKYKNLDEIKKRMRFTTHTPELAGNEEHDYSLLKEMSFFYHIQEHEVKFVLGLEGEKFNYTLAALKFSGKANAVSKLHGDVAREMWGGYDGICEIVSITNAQNQKYWQDAILAGKLRASDPLGVAARKKEMKSLLFKEVANQTGKLFDENVLTLVWARRFAAYKRADLLMHDWNRFENLLKHSKYSIQIIWAGKPYPEDTGANQIFNQIIDNTKAFPNCAVLVGYELGLSSLLKKGADVWLNNPKMYREASGTSGMTAAMNGAINLSIPDGWIPEFAIDGENCFLIAPADGSLSEEQSDKTENANLMDVLEKTVLPTYYDHPSKWFDVVQNGIKGVIPEFESARMAEAYYKQMYQQAD
ncbi:alpha-glucan family phosphorylase [Pedobacter alluvionis]|uniref:Alpha-glucan family phosphorylase n=1 Tax=Pedobacter alluvionis TaxID=475253 RepID=A0A497XT86_9SPHI|nr:alpha-glucan family phosphorylase [Pedobacter alluvionis]RLJ72541.1 starch phosphorylase [Pedobacter alluvionis]TFB28141.1 alpha-glucan family phosphorylase [Pedobacter alluvionis]